MRTWPFAVVTAASLAATCLNPRAAGQCEDYWQPMGVGADDTIFALTNYNGDLIAGGSFARVGCKYAFRVARWDGSAWHPLTGGGVNDSVHALAIYDDELIAGGRFTKAGGLDANYIASWNGSEWHPLGSGMSGEFAYVFAFAIYNGELIAGGRFTIAGGVSANNIARWTGKEWRPLGDGVQGGVNVAVKALAIFNGELIAGGEFSTAGGQPADNIARWDGSKWQPLTSGMNYDVYGLTIYKGDLIAGGHFDLAGGQSASRIARWDGASWHPLGEGVDADPEREDPALAWAFAEYNDELVVGGYFSKAGGQSAKSIARWDGSAWHPMKNGVKSSYGPDVYVPALDVFNNQLVVGGDFDTAGGELVNHVASWICDPCLADVTADGNVGVEDLLAMTETWGLCHILPPLCPGDIMPAGGDGVVDANDLQIILLYLQWGGSCTVWGSCQCPSDVNDDDVIDINDLFALLNAWGPCPPPPPPPCPTDRVQNGAVDIDDLVKVINAWGPCP